MSSNTFFEKTKCWGDDQTSDCWIKSNTFWLWWATIHYTLASNRIHKQQWFCWYTRLNNQNLQYNFPFVNIDIAALLEYIDFHCTNSKQTKPTFAISYSTTLACTESHQAVNDLWLQELEDELMACVRWRHQNFSQAVWISYTWSWGMSGKAFAQAIFRFREDDHTWLSRGK